MKKFKGAKILTAFVILFAMAFANVAMAFAAQQPNFPLIYPSPTGNVFVADADTQYIADFNQDPATKLITATIYIQNNSATQTDTLSGAGFAIGFNKDQVAPYNPGAGTTLNYPSAYDSHTTTAGNVLVFGDFIGGTGGVCPTVNPPPFNSASMQLSENDATASVITGKLTATDSTNYFILKPGQKAPVCSLYFKPTSSNISGAFNLNTFWFRYFANGVRKGSPLFGLATYFVFSDARMASSETYVLSPSSFKIQMHQSAPTGLSANNDARTVTGYDASTMEWSTSPTGPFNSGAPTIGTAPTKVYVRYKQVGPVDDTPVPVSPDPDFGLYKTMLASPATEVDFLVGPVDPNKTSVTKTFTNKTHSDGKVYVSDTIEYTITAANNDISDTVWANAVAKDILPAGVTFVANSIMINGAPAGANGSYAVVGTDRIVSATLGNIAGGTSKSFTFDVTVDNGTFGQTIKNAATVTGKGSDQPGATDVTKTGNDGNGFTVALQSPSPVIDPVYIGDTAVTGTGVAGDTISVTFPTAPTPTTVTTTVNPNGTWSVNLPAGYTPKVNDPISATQKSPGLDASPAVSTNVQPRPASNLAITKTVTDTATHTDGKMHVGDVLNYTITAKNDTTNTRALLTNVVVTDTLPTGITVDTSTIKVDGVAAGGNATITSGVLTVNNLSNLKGGDSHVITFTATINTSAYGQSIANSAKVAANDEGTPETKTGDDNNNTPVVAKSADPTIDQPTAGDTTVSGTGVKGVPGATVDVTVPDGHGGTTTIKNVPVDPATGVWTTPIPAPLANGDTVKATQTEPGKDPSTPAVEALVGPRPAAVKTVTKSSTDTHTPAWTDGFYHVGDVIAYTITVSNTGPAKSLLTNINVTDSLPAGLALVPNSVQIDGVAATSAQYTYVAPLLTVKPANLAGGASHTITFSATVQAGASGDTVTNSAKVASDDGSPDVTATEDTDKKVAPKSETPKIDPITPGDPAVTGKGVPGATVEVTFPDGKKVPVTVDPQGNWTAPLPAGEPPLKAGDTVTATQTEPGREISDPVNEPIGPRPDAVKTVTKSSTDTHTPAWTDGFYHVGDVIAYTITVKNSGPAKSLLSNIVVTDSIPAGLALVPGSVKIDNVAATSAQYTYAAPVLTVKPADLLGGASHTITFSATVQTGASGDTVTNSAKVASDDGSPDVTATEDTDKKVAPKSQDPTINPVMPNDPAVTGKGVPGATVEVTFPDGKKVPVTVDPQGNWTAPLPAGEPPLKHDDVISATQTEPGREPSSPPVTATVQGQKTAPPTIDPAFVGDATVTGTGIPGATVTVTATPPGYPYPITLGTATVDPNGDWSLPVPAFTSLVKDEVLSATQLDSSTPGNIASDPVTTTVQSRVPLSPGNITVTKAFENKSATDGNHPGNTVLYTITVANTGSVRTMAQSVVLSDVIPAGLTIDRDTVLLNGQVPTYYSYLSGTLRLNVGDLEGGQQAVVTFEVTINADQAGKTITNSATATGTDRATGAAFTPVTGNSPDLKVVDKSAQPTVNDVTKGDPTVSGKGDPGSTVDVTFPDGKTVPTTVDPQGNWSVPVPADELPGGANPLKPGDEITVTQTTPGSDPSEPVVVTVKDPGVRTVTGLVSPMTVNDLGLGAPFTSKFPVTVSLQPSYLTAADPKLTVTAVVTDPANLIGRFTITNVPYGSYVLSVSTPGYMTRYMNVTISASDPDVLTLAPPADPTNSIIPFRNEGGVFKLMAGDCNKDGVIDGFDTMMLLGVLNQDFLSYGKPAGYVTNCDLNRDGIIDGFDTMMLVADLNVSTDMYPGSSTVNWNN